MPNLQAPNHTATSLRAASKGVDEIRVRRRENIPTNLPPKEYTKQIRNQCQPLKYSDRLLKHLASLRGGGVSEWTPTLEKQTTSAGHIDVYILNAKATQAKQKSGDRQRTNNSLELALSTLKTTLILPTSQEHRKLPKPITRKSHKIHTSRLQYLNHNALPNSKHTIYETITSHISLERGTTKKQEATYKEDTYMTPSGTINSPYDVLATQDHRHLNNQITYLVTQWNPEILSQD
jgi:hypothetical protein